MHPSSDSSTTESRPARDAAAGTLTRRQWRSLHASDQTAAQTPTGRAPQILMICTGNVCRSALAEILLRAHFDERGVIVRSAGTHAVVGHGIPAEMQALAERYGGDPALVAGHRGRLLDAEMLADADLILTMTAAQSSHAVQLAPARLRDVMPVRTFARLSDAVPAAQLREAAEAAGDDPGARLRAVVRALSLRRSISMAPRSGEDVLDPFHRSAAVYQRSADQLVPALDEVIRVVDAALPSLDAPDAPDRADDNPAEPAGAAGQAR